MGFQRHASSASGRNKSEAIERSRREITSRQPASLELPCHWADAISESDWAIYRAAIRAIRQAKVPFLLGGGFALATFTGRWRDTKDIDFYIRREDRETVIAALTRAGFADYYRQRAYDRKWIHRTVKSGVIVDIIWAMANQRTRVDEIWFERAGSVTIREETLRVVPLEEF